MVLNGQYTVSIKMHREDTLLQVMVTSICLVTKPPLYIY